MSNNLKEASIFSPGSLCVEGLRMSQPQVTFLLGGLVPKARSFLASSSSLFSKQGPWLHARATMQRSRYPGRVGSWASGMWRFGPWLSALWSCRSLFSLLSKSQFIAVTLAIGVPIPLSSAAAACESMVLFARTTWAEVVGMRLFEEEGGPFLGVRPGVPEPGGNVLA
jgi:hypothetical protein